MSSTPTHPLCPADGSELEEYSPGAYRCTCGGRWLVRGHVYDDVRRLAGADLPRETDAVACPGCLRTMGVLRVGLLEVWVNWCEWCRSIWMAQPAEAALQLILHRPPERVGEMILEDIDEIARHRE